SQLGKYKKSKWLSGQGASPKKKPAPNDTAYAAALADPVAAPPDGNDASAPSPSEEPQATASLEPEADLTVEPVSEPDPLTSQVTIQVMPIVYDEEHKQPVEAEIEGPFAIHQDFG